MQRNKITNRKWQKDKRQKEKNKTIILFGGRNKVWEIKIKKGQTIGIKNYRGTIQYESQNTFRRAKKKEDLTRAH